MTQDLEYQSYMEQREACKKDGTYHESHVDAMPMCCPMIIDCRVCLGSCSKETCRERAKK